MFGWLELNGYGIQDIEFDRILLQPGYETHVYAEENKLDVFNKNMDLTGLQDSIKDGFYLPFIVFKKNGFLFLNEGFHRHKVSDGIHKRIPCCVLENEASLGEFRNYYTMFIYPIQQLAYRLEKVYGIRWHHPKLLGEPKVL